MPFQYQDACKETVKIYQIHSAALRHADFGRYYVLIRTHDLIKVGTVNLEFPLNC